MRMLSRRSLLQAGLSTAGLASLPGPGFTQVVGQAAPFDDYKALVCIFLLGGNDSFNMLVPRSTPEYDVYAASRQNLAVAQADLLPIAPLDPDGAEYGLHPSMAAAQGLFEAAQAAFVVNVGPLLEPTTKAQYLSGSATLPPGLFSHNDQQDQWHSLKGATTSSTGWAGRIADLIRDRVTGQQLALNASLFGNTLFQSGAQSVAYTMGPNGPLTFDGFGAMGITLEQRLAFERIIGADYDSVYERAFADVQRRAVATADLVSAAIDSAPPLATAFPASQLGTQLQTVARLIAVRDQLAMERQIFFVATGGFDTHDNQLVDQPDLLGNISDCMAAMHAATVELNVASSVTTFTQSDFGRTLTSNGDGTDHGWGGIQLVTGGAVLGQRLYGSYPLLEIGGQDDVGGGRMIPTTSADQYAATLARWFGIEDADMATIAPNLAGFAERDLGFLV
jgi:uncharacterized protein (DUF1501 family)